MEELLRIQQLSVSFGENNFAVRDINFSLQDGEFVVLLGSSGAGKSAMEELFHQTLDVYKNKPLKTEIFTKRIAFNLIPHIDKFLENGDTNEENKMIYLHLFEW